MDESGTASGQAGLIAAIVMTESKRASAVHLPLSSSSSSIYYVAHYRGTRLCHTNLPLLQVRIDPSYGRSVV